jgi:hypothetical protein
MYPTSKLHDAAITALLDMARPGILSRVFIPAGPADITNAMPIVRCLSGLDDAQSPDDVPAALLPRWASWLLCTIADNVSEEEYLSLVRGIADMLSHTVSHDIAWEGVCVAFVEKMTKMAIRLVAPHTAGSSQLCDLSRKLHEAVTSARRSKLHALDRLLDCLKLPVRSLNDKAVIDPLVFQMENGEHPNIENLGDVTRLPLRMTVWGAGLISGTETNARRMALNYDWSAFLLTNSLPGEAREYAGLDWVDLGQWLTASVVRETTHDQDRD